MRLLKWKHDYATGIDGVDADHRKLVQKVNHLHHELGAGDGRRSAVRFFADLERAFERQFRKEEQLMASQADSDFDDHKRDHDRLRDEIHDIAEVFSGSIEIDSVELAFRLDGWLSRHFRKFDGDLHNQLVET